MTWKLKDVYLVTCNSAPKTPSAEVKPRADLWEKLDHTLALPGTIFLKTTKNFVNETSDPQILSQPYPWFVPVEALTGGIIFSLGAPASSHQPDSDCSCSN